MFTLDTLTTPKEGWFLFNHYVEHHLSLIDTYAQSFHTARTTEIRRASAKTIEAVREQLLKNTERVMKQMRAAGHSGDAAKMQSVTDMIKEADLLDTRGNRKLFETYKEVCG